MANRARSTGDATALLSALTGPEVLGPRLILEASNPFKILLANPAWCGMMGYSADEVVGNSAGFLHGPMTCVDTLKALEYAMSGEISMRPSALYLHHVRKYTIRCLPP